MYRTTAGRLGCSRSGTVCMSATNPWQTSLRTSALGSMASAIRAWQSMSVSSQGIREECMSVSCLNVAIQLVHKRARHVTHKQVHTVRERGSFQLAMPGKACQGEAHHPIACF